MTGFSCAQNGVRIAEIVEAVGEIAPSFRLLNLTHGPHPVVDEVLKVETDVPVDREPHPGAEYDLVLACSGSGARTLGALVSRLSSIAGSLSSRGLVLLGVKAFAAPKDAADKLNARLLFPYHVAQEADAGGFCDPPLGPSSWRMAVRAAGLEVARAWGEGAQVLPVDYRALHAARLSLFDEVELGSGDLLMLLQKPGDVT